MRKGLSSLPCSPSRLGVLGALGLKPIELRRMISKDVGHGNILYGYLRRWRRAGLWARVMERLRQWKRQSQRRLSDPPHREIPHFRILLGHVVDDLANAQFVEHACDKAEVV